MDQLWQLGSYIAVRKYILVGFKASPLYVVVINLFREVFREKGDVEMI